MHIYPIFQESSLYMHIYPLFLPVKENEKKTFLHAMGGKDYLFPYQNLSLISYNIVVSNNNYYKSKSLQQFILPHIITLANKIYSHLIDSMFPDANYRLLLL